MALLVPRFMWPARIALGHAAVQNIAQGVHLLQLLSKASFFHAERVCQLVEAASAGPIDSAGSPSNAELLQQPAGVEQPGRAVSRMSIFVKTMTGRTLTFKVAASCTIAEFKESIYDVEGAVGLPGFGCLLLPPRLLELRSHAAHV